MDQDPARKHAERTFDDAHVLIEHQMMDMGAVEQCADRRNQHYIVSSNQFTQVRFSFAGHGGALLPLSTPSCPCRDDRRFLWLYPRIRRIGQKWRPAWRLLYPSRARQALRSMNWSRWSPP